MINTAEKPTNFEYAQQACDFLSTAGYKDALNVYQTVLNDPHVDDYVLAELGRKDRFFLLTMILNVSVLFHPWTYERCREVEAKTDNCIDLWARGHGKSAIITFAGSIQEIIKDSEITIGIFSHTRPIAKDFIRQIKNVAEMNPLLPRLYPDVFWANPRKEAPTWSLDDGIVFQRTGNPREATVEAWGLVDSQPTGKHFKLMIYDDTVEQKSVGTPEMIIKTTEAWDLSRNLSTRPPRTWVIGTRYNYADTYSAILARKIFTPRIYPATDNGMPDGSPVFLTKDEWEYKKKEISPYVLACQQLQNPLAGDAQELNPEWLRRYEVRPETLNVAITVDPASSKKKGSSNSAFAVIGIDSAANKYLLDGACHKMTLTERWQMLKYLRSKWVKQPGIQTVTVGYEKYGMQADIEHFKEMMRLQGCPFPIKEVSWVRDGDQAKDDRIRRLIPDHQNWRFFYPYRGEETTLQAQAISQHREFLIAKPIKRKNSDGRLYDLVDYLVSNEYLFFPATTAKDMLDSMSRFYDLQILPPMIISETDLLPDWYEDE
jgi:hypothetical protein